MGVSMGGVLCGGRGVARDLVDAGGTIGCGAVGNSEAEGGQ